MNKLDQYVHAATRDNTRSSYQSAVRHFEVEWGGLLYGLFAAYVMFA